MRGVELPTLVEIARSWDAIAELRAQQLDDGIDVSWTAVLVPMIEDLMFPCDSSAALDIGCGTGHLTDRFASRFKSIVAIDVSPASIAAATRRFHRRNVQFLVASTSEVSKLATRFTAAYANMSLQDTPSLVPDLRSIAATMEPNAVFAFTITHPCFWPTYWGYAGSPWFEYSKEIAICAPFRITNDQHSAIETIHFHRPISMYLSAITDAGFVIEKILEPIPAVDLPDQYRANWRFPRFLGVRSRKAPQSA